MNKMFVRRSGSAPISSTPSAWRQKITAGLAAAVLCGLTLGANLAEAQTVPQPANPPLWNGVAYGPTGPGLYEYNDAIFSVGADRLHNIGIRGQGLTAAIVNGGFYTDHEIFDGKIVNGFDGQTGGLSDHGTHVSGIVLSMVPDAHLWLGTYIDAVAEFKAIAKDAATYNIVTVNNSWGDPIEGLYKDSDEVTTHNPAVNAEVQNLLQQGIIVVAASGNQSVNDRMSSPEGLPGVLAVGALNQFGYIVDFSTQHQKDGLFLVAPGAGINSATEEWQGVHYYDTYNGTSMASPHVAGAATLLQSGARNATSEEIIDSLYDSAERIPYDGNAIVLKEHMPSGRDPRNVKDVWLTSMTSDADISKYVAWIDAVIVKWDADEVTADEWRVMNHIMYSVRNCRMLDNSNSTFVVLMEATGDLAPLQFIDFGFLRVDKAYMDLTGKRMDKIAKAIDPGLSGILHGYANELRADINQDTADIFQRLDAQNVATQTRVARQMSPRFTNATAESAHLGFVGLHRSMARRTELNRLGQGSNGSSACAPCNPCEPCEPCGPCDDVCSPRGHNVEVSGWIEGFGTGFNKSGTLANAAYDGHFAGTAFGVERKRGNRTLGFFGSYANHRVSGDGLAKGDWANFGVYGRVDQRRGFVEGSFAYGYGDYDLTRNVFIPGAVFSGVGPDAAPIVLPAMFRQAKASTHAHDFSMRVAGGRDLWRANGWKAGPRTELSLSHLAFNRYQETGAQSLNLSVDGYKTTYVEGGAGLFAGKQFHIGAEHFVATGKVMGMYGGVAGNNLSGRFLQFGSPYQVTAGHMSTAWVVPEASLAWNITDGVVLSGGYSGRFGKKYSENTGTVGLNLYW